MPKGGQRDLVKERSWRQVFAEWQKTGLSGAEYCRQHDLKYTQWNDWHKQIRKLDAEAATFSSHRRRMAARAQGIADRISRQQQTEHSVEFAEVQVIDDQARTMASKEKDATALEVVFASGTKLRLPAGCPLDLLASVIAVLENR